MHPEAKTDIAKLYNQGYVDNICNQVGEDIHIWKYKTYRRDPILCDGDGPINQYRKWFSQLYAEDISNID